MATMASPNIAERTKVTFAEHKKAIENHKKIAEHLQEAARHHMHAARHIETGAYEKAKESTLKAHEHLDLATEAQNENLKHYERHSIGEYLEFR